MAKRIDDSHQPFKRTRKLGPGPKKHPTVWEDKAFICTKGKDSKTHYVQLCKYQGADGATHIHRIQLSKKWKKKYNKVYHAWAAVKRKALVARGAKPTYVCRKTPAGTKCK